jgi:hypothetical protein
MREDSGNPANDAIPPGLRLSAACAWQRLVTERVINEIPAPQKQIASERIDFAGHAGGHALSAFARVQAFVAAIDAAGIGIGAWLLGVVLGTIAGALPAFPVIATANAMIHAAANYHSGTPVRNRPAESGGNATP